MGDHDTPLMSEALGRLDELEEIERRLTDASVITADLFLTAHRSTIDSLIALCAMPVLQEELQAEFSKSDKDLGDLQFLLDKIGVEPDMIAERIQRLKADRLQDPKFRLAQRFIGSLSLNGTEIMSLSNRAWTEAFLSRPPEELADDLLGRELYVNDKKATITGTQSLDGETNQNWLKRPVYGKYRSDIYVANFRGNFLLFIRAGDSEHTDCSVRIVGVSHDGVNYDKSSMVSRVLGLNEEQIGNLKLDGEILKIADLRPRKPQIPTLFR